jgi:opacity protein-like surface antigen
MRLTKALLLSVLSATFLNAGAASASAQPVRGIIQVTASANHNVGVVEHVQYREGYNGRRDDRRGNYRRNDGRNVGLGIAGLIIGGIVLSEAARAEHRGSHGGDWQRCSQTYRSFERNTGMYTGYDGTRRPCPYLN